VLRRSFSSTAEPLLKQTPLFSRHVELQGKMVPFAGYSLPVMYKPGIMKEHQHTRTQASVFDVSHMGQVRIKGKDRVAYMERLICADLVGLKDGEASLTLFTNDKGGVIDDAIIANAGNYLHLVVNGACKEKDINHMRKHLTASKLDASLEVLENATLIALQGPKAAEALKSLKVKIDLDKMPFMTGKDNVEIAGVNCRVTRCGYTGEDGFEISCEKNGPKVFDALLAQQYVHPCGLGARDSLRLEAGLCLYGHELDETILPVEASLAWVVNKNRRTGSRANFLGATQVLAQLSKENAPKRKRVGFFVNGAPAREGTVVFSEGKEVGVITSGTFSPSLNKPIAMGYVSSNLSANGTKLTAQVRGKDVPIVVEKMPFVPSHYFKVA